MLIVFLLSFTLFFIFIFSLSHVIIMLTKHKYLMDLNQKKGYSENDKKAVMKVLDYKKHNMNRYLLAYSFNYLHHDRFFNKSSLQDIDWHYLLKLNNFFVSQHRYYLKQYILLCSYLNQPVNLADYLDEMSQKKRMKQRVFFNN